MPLQPTKGPVRIVGQALFNYPFNCPSTLKGPFLRLERTVSPLTATQGQPAFSIFYHIYRTRLKYLL